MKLKELETDFPSCDVSLSSLFVWAIREQRLYGADNQTMEFNIKIDGRTLGGLMNLMRSYHCMVLKTHVEQRGSK